MYGIVNKAIEDLVMDKFGPSMWERVKSRSGVDIDFFISNEPYDDALTFTLAHAVAEETGMGIKAVLEAFGEWWVLKTGQEKYGGLMKAGGDNLKDFLMNLPQFHNRIILIYPKLTPPEFRISDVEERSLFVHYFSKREGLQDFVRGLLAGLGKLFETPVNIILLESRNDGNDHEVFKVEW
jgi:hypothetical protein